MANKRCARCGNAFDAARDSRLYCSRSCSNSVIAQQREAAKASRRFQTVWSCGGGVESTAIAVLIEQGILRPPDHAVMVDCGWESTATMRYVTEVIAPRLQSAGVVLNIIQTTDYADTDIVDGRGTVLLPVYMRPRTEGAKPGRFRTLCNGTWKERPVRRWLRAQGVEQCEQWVGISAGEARRERESPLRWLRWSYPLLELGYDREDCLWTIAQAGWPKPFRTNCIICPNQSDRQWSRMETQDMQRAIEADERLRRRNPDAYLHRSLRPLAEIFGGDAEGRVESYPSFVPCSRR